MKPNCGDVVIVSVARTPIGSFRGSLSSLPATKLGSIAIQESINRSGFEKECVQEVIMGNAIQSGAGQSPARQAALGAGLSTKCVTTTVNKVCASGIKAVSLGAQSIILGHSTLVVAGGMESLSNAPYFLTRGTDTCRTGQLTLTDSLEVDGLTDVYSGLSMGLCGDKTAKDMAISREEQDTYAIESYRRSFAAIANGKMEREIVPVVLSDQHPEVIIREDEELGRFDESKLLSMSPRFSPEGTLTAANAGNVGDGAAACVLAAGGELLASGRKGLARVVDFAEGGVEPVDVCTAPAAAIRTLLHRTGLRTDDVELWEINEAFSVIALATMRTLGLDHSKVNVDGGSVGLGHPFAMSGTRVVNHLALSLKSGQYGVAVSCNGGGEAAAILLQGC